MKTIYRKEKIKMFLKDYYFGYGKWITLLRLIGGPGLILIGLDLYRKGFDKFSVAYSGFCILYGIYMIFKPYLWVLFRLDNYRTENIAIQVDEDSLLLTDDKNESKIGFETFKKIFDRKSYYSFVISKSQRLRIPKRLIDKSGQEIIEDRIKTHYNILYKNDGFVRRYSEGFKLKILAELSTGNYSKKKLGEIYGINRTTINEWIKKYDRKDLMNTRVIVETQDETTRLKALQKEIKQLKELLIKKDLDRLVLDSYLEVAAEKLGCKSVEELKKNLSI